MYAHGLCDISLSWFFSVLLDYYLASSNFCFKLFLEVSWLLPSWCIFEQISNTSLERTSDNQICASASNPFPLSGNFTHPFANNSHWGINPGIFSSSQKSIDCISKIHSSPMATSYTKHHHLSPRLLQNPFVLSLHLFFPSPSCFLHKSQNDSISTHVWSHYFLP